MLKIKNVLPLVKNVSKILHAKFSRNLLKCARKFPTAWSCNFIFQIFNMLVLRPPPPLGNTLCMNMETVSFFLVRLPWLFALFSAVPQNSELNILDGWHGFTRWAQLSLWSKECLRALKVSSKGVLCWNKFVQQHILGKNTAKRVENENSKEFVSLFFVKKIHLTNIWIFLHKYIICLFNEEESVN